MSCVACGKSIGFTNDGAKFCSGCSDLVRRQRKCEIPGCNSFTEAFYTQCTYHYYRLQKEIRQAHRRKLSSPPPPAAPGGGNHRPYKSTTVSERRRDSKSPPRKQQQQQPPQPTTTTSAPAPQPLPASKPAPQLALPSPPTLPQQQQQQPTPETPAPAPQPQPPKTQAAAAAAATKPDASASARRVMKRTEQVAQHEHRKRARPPMNPNVIVEYECNACGAVNVVTREVRFLQTFVVRDNTASAAAANELDSSTTAASGAADGCDTKSLVSPTDDMRDEDAEREVNAILNCKDTGNDDCEFQVNIPNASAK